KLDQPRHKTAAALQTNPSLCLPPMRRIGLLVTWKLLDPLHPGRDAGKACLEAIKAQRQGNCFWAPRGPQQKLQVWIGDDVGGCEIGAAIQPPPSADPSNRARLTSIFSRTSFASSAASGGPKKIERMRRWPGVQKSEMNS